MRAPPDLEVRVHRRLAIPVAAATLALLGGCGGSSASGASSSPSAAASEAALTPAQARTIAVAAQLQASDLPGFAEDKKAAGDAEAPDATEKEVQACVSGTQAPKYLADVNSSDFTKGQVPSQLQVSSETQVVATKAQATSEFAKLKEPATLTCLNTALKKALSSQAEGGSFTGELKRVESDEEFGSDGAARFVLDGALSAQGITIKMHVDLDQAVVDRAEITVSSLAIGQQGLPAADRDRLIRAVVDRARAAQKS
jgi:hypothetical protein